MLKFSRWIDLLIVLIILWLLCSIGIVLSGCSLLPTSGSSIVTGAIPSATQQLWKAAKGSNWLVTMSILGIAAGAFAFFNGSKIGIPCIGASCISLFMALAVARFSTWMAVFGLIGSLASVGISVLVKNRAVKEIVTGVQTMKDCQPTTKGVANTILADIQSKSTRKLVQNVKSKLKLKGKL